MNKTLFRGKPTWNILILNTTKQLPNVQANASKLVFGVLIQSYFVYWYFRNITYYFQLGQSIQYGHLAVSLFSDKEKLFSVFAKQSFVHKHVAKERNYPCSFKRSEGLNLPQPKHAGNPSVTQTSLLQGSVEPEMWAELISESDLESNSPSERERQDSSSVVGSLVRVFRFHYEITLQVS